MSLFSFGTVKLQGLSAAELLKEASSVLTFFRCALQALLGPMPSRILRTEDDKQKKLLQDAASIETSSSNGI